MRAHKSAFLGLALGALALGVTACEDKDSDIVLPPPAVEITMTPAGPIELQVDETVTVNANVTGGDATTDRTVTFSSSNASVASVSGNVVTAEGPGSATITATNAANSLTASVQVVVTQPTTPPPPPPAQQPTISIQSITTGNTLTPVNINNVFGQIDITLNVDIPAGNNIDSLTVKIGNQTVCKQTFTGGSLGGAVDAAAAAAQVEIVCSVNTAEFNTATGAARFPNGTYQVSAQLYRATGSIAASTATTLVFNNTDHFVLTTTTGTGPVTGTVAGILPAGSAWFGGAVTATLRPVIFTGAGSNVQSATVSMTSSGVGTAGCAPTSNALTDPTIVAAGGTPGCGPVTITRPATLNADGSLTATFPLTGTGNVGNQEDVWAFSVGGAINASGQAGPTCVNPDPTRNPIAGGACAGADTFFGFGTLGHTGRLFANPLALDNLAPRFRSIAFTGPSYAPPAVTNNYVDGSVTFSHTAQGTAASGTNGSAVTIDYGVDAQTATFQAGPAGSLSTVTSTAQIPESVTDGAYVLQVTTTDALGNARSLFSTGVNTTFSTTAGGALAFGIDQTPPTFAVTPNGDIVDISNPFVVNANTWTFTYSDSGIGPSGFGATPVMVSLERFLPGSSPCVIGTGSSCAAIAQAIPPGGTLDFTGSTGVEGYYRLNTWVNDAAGNASASDSELGLRDITFPVVAPIGGPASINGNGSASFTSSMSDNVELGRIDAFLGYDQVISGAGFTSAVNGYVAGPSVTVGTIGETTINNTSPGNVTFNNFIVSLETTLAGGRPSGAVTAASSIEYNVLDVAAVETETAATCPALGTAAPVFSNQNCTQRSDQIFTNVANGTPGTTTGFVSLGTNGPAGFANPAQASHGNWVHSTNDATLEVSPLDGATLSATATGPNATFVAPWSRVEFWVQRADGNWYMIGTAGAPSATDNTITATRTWTYTLAFNPTSADVGSTQTVAVGVHTDGRALLSNMVGVTVIQ